MKKIKYISQNSTEDSMIQGVKLKTILFFGAATFVFLMFLSADIVRAEDNPVGNVTGYIFAQDGSTPVEGAVVKFKNVNTFKFYESEKSDSRGHFVVEGIERGIYLYGVITPEASFNSEGLVGLRLKKNETAKMSVALKPYSSAVVQTLAEFYQDLDATGESYVGRVIEVDTSTKNVKVKVERGFLQVKDKIRNLGSETNFEMKVDSLKSEGVEVNRVFAEQTASFQMKKEAYVGDMIYVLKKNRFSPLLALPIGAAAGAAVAFATSGSVDNDMSTMQLQSEVEAASAIKNKKK
jgi:hypothetical protein